MMSITTWWWIVRHPIKAAAIRRYFAAHPENEK